jgi:hypothetical protein
MSFKFCATIEFYLWLATWPSRAKEKLALRTARREANG